MLFISSKNTTSDINKITRYEPKTRLSKDKVVGAKSRPLDGSPKAKAEDVDLKFNAKG